MLRWRGAGVGSRCIAWGTGRVFLVPDAGPRKATSNAPSRANSRSWRTPAAAASIGENASREWEDEMEELEKLIALLPASVRGRIEEHPRMAEVLEVVMDLGRPPVARFPEGDVKLAEQAITWEDLEQAVAQVGEFGGDNRAGIDRTLHRISCIRNRSGKVIGLTCRVGRAVKGSARMVADLVMSGASILFLGRPGVGKTTAIREVSRALGDDLRKRVVIVDTSNEIGGDGDIPHRGIGRARRLQVPNPEQQHRVMIEAVENHTPEVVIIDEIGTLEECLAARTIAQRGVQLVATAHGNELENVIKNPSLADLVGGIQSVTLGDEEARKRGVQKSILERAGPPTFDVAIEMLERYKWRVHLDVAHVVDVLLTGGQPGGQVRERAADGAILRYNYVPALPPATPSLTTPTTRREDMGSKPGAAVRPGRDSLFAPREGAAGGGGGVAGSGSNVGGPARTAAARTAAAAAAAVGNGVGGGGLGSLSRNSWEEMAGGEEWPVRSPPSSSPLTPSAAAAGYEARPPLPHPPPTSQEASHGPPPRSVDMTLRRSSFLKPSLADSLDAEDEEGGGVPGGGAEGLGEEPGLELARGARRLVKRQAKLGLGMDNAQLRLFPFGLDADKLWEVLSAMDLATKVLVVKRVSQADAVLGMRLKVKASPVLRLAAKAARVPIYAIKTESTGTLVRALRTLLGTEPTAGGMFVRTSSLADPPTAASPSAPPSTAEPGSAVDPSPPEVATAEGGLNGAGSAAGGGPNGVWGAGLGRHGEAAGGEQQGGSSRGGAGTAGGGRGAPAASYYSLAASLDMEGGGEGGEEEQQGGWGTLTSAVEAAAAEMQPPARHGNGRDNGSMSHAVTVTNEGSSSSSSSSSRGEGVPRSPPLPSAALRQALEEVQVACEELAGVLGQPVDLLPRSPPIIQEQQAVVQRYGLQSQVLIGINAEQRLRVLPRSKDGTLVSPTLS